MNERISESRPPAGASTKRHSKEEPEGLKEPSYWQVILSVLSAVIGIQNSRNQERDFTQGRILPYIIVGVVFTFLFVISLIGIVKVVLS